MHTFKRTLAALLVVMLMVGMLGVLPASADGGYDAKLAFADTAWGAQEWGDNAKTTVTGDGTYTISWDIPEGGVAAIDAGVFCVDIVGAQAALDAENKTYNVTALTVTADGVDIPVDVSKLVTGDLEANGNFRIEIYNQYGSTPADPPIDPAAVVFSSNLTVTFTIETIEKPAEGEGTGEISAEWDAFLMFTDVDWAFGNWDAALANTKVTGAGTYTVTLNATDVGGDGTTGCNGINVFCVDITGASASLLEQGKALSLADIKVIADGNEVTIDKTKIATGDIEENGNFRIEIYNTYGVNAADPAIDYENFTFAQTLSVEFTLDVVDAATGEPVPEETEPSVVVPEFDANGTYNAYLGIQTPNWTYRDPWNSANGIGSDYWGDFIYGNETSEKYGKVTDAVVAGNGTYTVSITDFGTIFADDFTAAGQEYFNLLYISTDIPLSDAVTVSDVKLIIDGKTIQTYDEAYLDPDEAEYVKILIQNIWNADVAELNYYAAPSSKLEMQFTISGFAYDAEVPETEPAATEPAPTTPAPTEPEGNGNILPIIIGVVAVVAIAAVVVIVMKKKKA